MNAGFLKAKLAGVVILAAALLGTSLEAKLGLYHPIQSQAHLISKTFKISECRLARAVSDPPPAVAREVMSAPTETDPRQEPELLVYSPGPPAPVHLSRSHFFRPPPTYL